MHGGHWAKRLLPGLLATSLMVGCGDDSPTGSSGADIQGLRYNQVMFKQIHNAYIERDSQKYAPCLDYTKGTIESQLTVDPTQPWKGGALGIELDIWVTKYTQVDGETQSVEWEVKHVGDFDDANWPEFSSYLQRLKAWCDAHPNHPVITIKIEEKRYGKAIPLLNRVWAGYSDYTSWYNSQFKPKFGVLLDDYLRAHFDVRRIYTPGMLQGSASTLEAGAKRGWPTMKELQGKFIFFVMGDDAANSYAGDRPQDRLCFQRGGLEDPNCVFTKAPETGLATTQGLRQYYDGFAKSLREAREKHPEKIFAAYLGKHCTNVLSFDTPCPDEDHFDWCGAFGAGVNIIQTDMVNSASAMTGPEGYWPVPAQTKWRHTGVTREAKITTSPCAIEYKDYIYVLFDNNYQPKLVRGWPGDFLWSYQTVGGGESRDRPAAAVYKDKLWMFSMNKGRTSLMARTYDGTTWSSSTALTSAALGPGAAVFKGKLFVFYANAGKEIMWMNFDGSRWSEPAKAIGATSREVTACVHNGKLKILFKSSSSNNIYMAYYDGKEWSDQINVSGINGALSDHAPTATVDGDYLYVAIKGQSSTAPMYVFSILGDRNISSQSYIYTSSTLGNQETQFSPAPICVDGKLLVFFKIGDTEYLHYVIRE